MPHVGILFLFAFQGLMAAGGAWALARWLCAGLSPQARRAILLALVAGGGLLPPLLYLIFLRALPAGGDPGLALQPALWVAFLLGGASLGWLLGSRAARV